MRISKKNMKSRVRIATTFFKNNPTATVLTAYKTLKTNPALNGIGINRSLLGKIKNKVLNSATPTGTATKSFGKSFAGIPPVLLTETTPPSALLKASDPLPEIDQSGNVEGFLFGNDGVVHVIGTKGFVLDTLTRVG